MTADKSTEGRLAGKAILVTGGSRGIGAAIVKAALREGADVAFSYISSTNQAARPNATSDSRRFAIRSDASDPSAVQDLVHLVERQFGRVDGLVNNAGIMPITPFLEISADEWDRVLRTDLYAAYFSCQAVLPGMIRRRSGSIVSISSRLAHVGAAGHAHYSAAKAGLIGLTRALAREFGPDGIRVNAVAPGPTPTDMGMSGMRGEEADRKLAELPLQRFPQVEDVAAAVTFLLSDDAAAFTGQTLNPNGGGYMG